MKTCKRQQCGFSLLEILIAFSILALSLGILLNIFSGGVNTAMIADDYTVAVQIAESLMAKTGSEIPIKDHQSSGVENEKYRWSLSIRPYTPASEAIDPKNIAAEIFKVNAIVAWGEGEGGSDDREVQLATLKLAGKKNAPSALP